MHPPVCELLRYVVCSVFALPSWLLLKVLVFLIHDLSFNPGTHSLCNVLYLFLFKKARYAEYHAKGGA